ncbi:aminomethyl-transferring glycine dehydrogenase subunit GcvPA [Desulfobulbus rhabdoformis]|jgi:glycine dehydrogenase subunit 1|uniref:aminomethyl-transferring glycine dehydrogenase subunit GcvPA n=1 Tax=Desulfobulbus rhabdoformis TaxID=34032 RepID=UPI0019658957|nr:aminomethyl-transferring glycine dehydrogenase subunit GcvPA [Desulfobulbus rhabdoformis]MBM9613447.1 aminomethyl-transferring glycine dehydrogenase subunit GcvPA [Desulfobulbus rhabdoformis]
MRYLPHTPEDISDMLTVIGADSLDGLFASVPEACRMTSSWDLPQPQSEWQLNDHMRGLAADMAIGEDGKVLIGAGSYRHYIPETIRTLASRSEFLTAYTPYQPEMAQGTLQGIFEYQTLTARLLGVDVVNASMYDGASALAEALLMGLRIAKKKKKVAISKAIHPHYRGVVAAYLRPTSYEIIELELTADGRTDLSSLSKESDIAAVALQSPNFFGVIEELEQAATTIHDAGSLFVACFSEPLAYGLLKNPGDCGADIVCGEGQSFGIAPSFGGPGLGMFGCKTAYTRNLPGRLVGETKDLDGKRGYVLTLATREQHIRREKATSNICSNQGVCAMTAAMYMASLGGTGLRQLSRLNFDKSEYLKAQLLAAGASLVFAAPTFNEFVVRFPGDFSAKREKLLKQGIVAGLDLGDLYPELAGAYLFCVTETIDKATMDTIATEVAA